MKKPEKPKGKGGRSETMPDEGFAKRYPLVAEYLVTTAWTDGSARIPSALSLFVEDGVAKVALNDKDLKQSLYASGDSWEGALQALEAVLEAGDGHWRTWSSGKRKN